MSPWVSLRMNDVHFNDNVDHPFHSDFWRDASRWRGGNLPIPYFARGLNWERADVRDQYRKLVVETLERYDIDGLELDFMREPYLFREGEEIQGAAILTEWLRGIRLLLDETGAKRGHPIGLGVRVPSRFEVAKGWGLDVVEWAKAGLVNLVVVTPRFVPLEFDMPMAEWKELIGPTRVTVAGGLESLTWPASSPKPTFVTPAEAIGAATAVLHGGGDAVYLFNYSLGLKELWVSEYDKTLSALNSIDKLTKLPRDHLITWRDVTGPHENYKRPLPTTGTTLSVDLPTGPAPTDNQQVTLVLELTGGDPPSVTINGEGATLKKMTPGSPLVLEYKVPTTALAKPRARIDVKSVKDVEVVGVRVSISDSLQTP